MLTITVSIFQPGQQRRVFDLDFTMAALAFLCSRLLEVSKNGRAAAVIQRAYRKSKNREMIRQRCILIKVAYDCKAVFETRLCLWKAARRLQNAWRAYQRRKRGRATFGGSMSATSKVARFEKQSTKQQTGQNVDIWLM